MSSRAVVCASKEVHACPWSRSGLAAERPWSPSVSAPHRESLARPTGPGLLTYLIVPKVPKVPKYALLYTKSRVRRRACRRTPHLSLDDAARPAQGQAVPQAACVSLCVSCARARQLSG